MLFICARLHSSSGSFYTELVHFSNCFTICFLQYFPHFIIRNVVADASCSWIPEVATLVNVQVNKIQGLLGIWRGELQAVRRILSWECLSDPLPLFLGFFFKVSLGPVLQPGLTLWCVSVSNGTFILILQAHYRVGSLVIMYWQNSHRDDSVFSP